MIKNTILPVSLVLNFILIIPTDAYAYLDPGTGSLFLQALAAGIIVIGTFWRRITAFFKSLFYKEKK